MPVTEELMTMIEPEIERIEEELRRDLQAISVQYDGLLVDILSYGLFSGGKKIRPLLAVVAARLCGGCSEQSYKVAIALEYLHLATLMHDDVIDRSDFRRGKGSVQKVYGIEGAILAGDFLHARAMEMIGIHGGSQALRLICKATKGMANGEFVQLRNVTSYSQREEDYYKAVEGKTTLLLSAAVQIGGLTSSDDRLMQDALYVYGKNLGYAFQIIDDVLDYTGMTEKTGKEVGNDLIEGKLTLPLLLTLLQASHEEQSFLTEILHDRSRRKASFSEVVRLIEHYSGFEQCRRKAEACVETALSALTLFDAPEQAEDVALLSRLAEFILVREK